MKLQEKMDKNGLDDGEFQQRKMKQKSKCLEIYITCVPIVYV